MKNISNAGRWFYAIALVVYGVQQFIFADFRPVFVPAWQSYLPFLPVWAYLFGIWLILAAAAIILEKRTREVLLLTGGILLALVVFVQLPFEIIADPYNKHLVMWTNALKELALSGGAFVVAGTFPGKNDQPVLVRSLEKLIPFGHIFFCITMITFGIIHFLYVDGVAALVPAYFPKPIFWSYLSGVALVGSGLAIMLKIRTREVAALLALMIFIWFLVLHIPRAADDPSGNRGNEFASAFDALAFTGIALGIASGGKKK
ncbi:hypothetical protein GVN16_07330 [Emticicia sp. CRIBPO]|uniref:hypothetical protein n=1 Tax=Emticicia sp. CRIBPO TaxID=2683258 RepID=UPI0014133C6A|nr:hypothetical protein [Emticicia sp. CRIBPO]NBA85566.1 hypothetical protein [Emticicia sp. CRIBPO]